MMKALRRIVDGISIPIIAILLGLLASSVFVALSGARPLDAYQSLFCEGFGPQGCTTFGDLVFTQVTDEDTGSVQTVFSPLYGAGGNRWALVLEQATPLILTALSAAVAFQAGMFSIGMDGQFILGAITVAFLGVWLPQQVYGLAGVDPDTASEGLLTVMHLIIPLICIAAAMIVGAIYSWIPAQLKIRLNVNELISTIILNAIAVKLVEFLVTYPLNSDPGNIARTARIDDTAWLIPFNRALFSEVDWFSGARLGIGLIFALLAAFGVWFFLWRTTGGYEQRMTRGSSLFARFGGIPSAKAATRAMLISGALSGLAGAIAILGVERRVVDGFALSGTGFEGVLVAILAKESIIGILLVAPFIAGLNLGATNLQFGNLPRELGGIIISFIILFSAMEDFLRLQLGKLLRRGRTLQRSKGEAVQT